MAALDTPWMSHMSTPKRTPTPRGDVDGNGSLSDPPPSYAPPTYASFSPATLSGAAAASAAKRRSTILVHQKSPLLLATPPQITRALAYSHPFLLPLNKLAGLLSWTTADPWESFLLLVAFWATVQYGDVVLRLAGPIVVVVAIIGGMYGRRYSPLSSSGWGEHPSAASEGKNKKKNAGAGPSTASHASAAGEATSTRHQKTLDEIVETLRAFTSRCNILLEPLLEMTDFLSTQRTATSATTRPALTALFVRILAVTPVWIALTLPPLRIITTRRVVMVFGTMLLTWHSRVCRVTRTLLWRSALVRRLARWATGLHFEGPSKPEVEAATDGAQQAEAAPATKPRQSHEAAKLSSSALAEARRRGRRPGGEKEAGVRFTFILYENQRRWLGLGWTNSLFAYERAAWTDEQNNAVPPRDDFELPEVEDGLARWRWVEGSRWRVDGLPDLDEDGYHDAEAGKMGWIFYDNKWQNGRRGSDGWGRWTRRRKWYRDAELVEVTGEEEEEEEKAPRSPSPPALPARPPPTGGSPSGAEKADTSSPEMAASDPERDNKDRDKDKDTATDKANKGEDDAASVLSTSSKSTSRFRFPGPSLRRRATGSTSSQQHSHPQQEKQEKSEKQQQQQQEHQHQQQQNNNRNRRTSETASLRSNDGGERKRESTLTPALELEIQGHQKGQDQWGVGDEVMMGLE
ncbi:Pex24p-domain-containing protein [Xylariaceae sp. FL0804]|nr:Pex24p-domain-containing protein [Xylariaceae sp. FL0804]